MPGAPVPEPLNILSFWRKGFSTLGKFVALPHLLFLLRQQCFAGSWSRLCLWLCSCQAICDGKQFGCFGSSPCVLACLALVLASWCQFPQLFAIVGWQIFKTSGWFPPTATPPSLTKDHSPFWREVGRDKIWNQIIREDSKLSRIIWERWSWSQIVRDHCRLSRIDRGSWNWPAGR